MEPEKFSYKPYELGFQNVVSPPTNCINKGVLQKFNTCKESIVKSFCYLLQYTAKDAILHDLSDIAEAIFPGRIKIIPENVPTLTEYKFDSIVYRILNYTNDFITSFPNGQLVVSHYYLNLTETKGKYNIIIYKLKQNPNVVRLEINMKGRPKPEQRFFIKNQNSLDEQKSTQDISPASLTQHHTRITDIQKTIESDANLKMLLENIPKEADLTKIPKLLYFSARVQSCFFTVLNYTNHDITFDIDVNLCINGKKFKHFKENSQIVAYHLERHPEIICFEKKDVYKKTLSPTFFAKMRWEASPYPIAASSFKKDSSEVFSYKPFELGLQQIVSPPTYCMNEGALKRFDSNDERTITNFQYLLQYTAKDAILNEKPTFIKYNLNGTIIKILNYSTEIIRISEEKKMFLNDLPTDDFDDTNCDVIAYNVKGLPDITFIDQQNDNDKFEILPRQFIAKDYNNRYSWNDITAKKHSKYSSQHYTQLLNPNIIISKDSNLKMLVDNIPKDADLTKNPKLLYFSARINSCFFTVLNYTKHDITFDISRTLCINGRKFRTFINKDCGLVAYHLKNDPEIIYFRQKIVISDQLSAAFLATMIWNKSDKQPSAKIFEDARIYKAFKTFFYGSIDENSILSQIPTEIFGHVFSNHDNLIQRFIKEQEEIEKEKEQQKIADAIAIDPLELAFRHRI